MATLKENILNSLTWFYEKLNDVELADRFRSSVIDGGDYENMGDEKLSDGKVYYVYNIVPAPLNDYSWAEIREIADSGKASSYWAVGDRKAVTLNGTVGMLNFDNETYYAFIIGFNHNADIEGNNVIHFQFGYDALEDGTAIAFIDSDYGYEMAEPAFRMNLSNSNYGGWESSFMRNTIMPEFEVAMPSDLQAVLKDVIKYTDNVGGRRGNVEGNVTPTTDRCFLLNYTELGGASSSYANSYEANYTRVYGFYSESTNTNLVRKRHDTGSTSVDWWTRSPSRVGDSEFCYVGTSGSLNFEIEADLSYGIAPAFVV